MTLGGLISVMPFGLNATTTTLTGAQLWKALENGESGYPTEGRFPQVTGFRFAFDPNRPARSRVTEVTLDVSNPTKAISREPFLDAVVEKLKADLARGVVTMAARLEGRITRF